MYHWNCKIYFVDVKMSKITKEFRRMNLEELEKKEAELKIAIRIGETRARGFGMRRSQPPEKKGVKTPPFKKMKRMMATLLTIKKEKENENNNVDD